MGLARTVAAVFGAVYLLAGILGFILVPGGEGDLLGLFAVNALHNIVHILLGAILLYGATGYAAAIMTLRGVGGVLLLLGILGFIDPFPDLVPLGGNDIFLHLITGAILLAAGFMATDEASATV